MCFVCGSKIRYATHPKPHSPSLTHQDVERVQARLHNAIEALRATTYVTLDDIKLDFVEVQFPRIVAENGATDTFVIPNDDGAHQTDI